MSITQDELVEKLGNLSVLEMIALTKTLEEKWGVKAAPQVSTPQPLPADPPGPTGNLEQTEFTVMLTGAGTNKIQTIKVLREVTGLGLNEAKDSVDALPKVIKEGISKGDAEEIRAKFTAAGATVEVK